MLACIKFTKCFITVTSLSRFPIFLRSDLEGLLAKILLRSKGLSKSVFSYVRLLLVGLSDASFQMTNKCSKQISSLIQTANQLQQIKIFRILNNGVLKLEASVFSEEINTFKHSKQIFFSFLYVLYNDDINNTIHTLEYFLL